MKQSFGSDEALGPPVTGHWPIKYIICILLFSLSIKPNIVYYNTV